MGANQCNDFDSVIFCDTGWPVEWEALRPDGYDVTKTQTN